MLKALEWSCRVHDGGDKELVADIVSLNFKDFKNHDYQLDMRYLILDEFEDRGLYFECNFELFKIGTYKQVEIAQKKALTHFRELAKIFSITK